MPGSKRWGQNSKQDTKSLLSQNLHLVGGRRSVTGSGAIIFSHVVIEKGLELNH